MGHRGKNNNKEALNEDNNFNSQIRVTMMKVEIQVNGEILMWNWETY